MKSEPSIMTCGILAVAFAFVASQPVALAQDGAGVQRRLDGVWLITTTPKACDTGTPFPAAAFEGLFTFHADGTMSAWMQTAFITTERSPSHGLWQREHSWRDYSFKFVLLRYEASSYIGRQESRGSLVLDASGNMFTTNGSTEFFDTSGSFLGRGCASSVGIRFE